MTVVEEVLKFREALDRGYYNNDRRAIFAITFDEAMDLWRELERRSQEEWWRRRYVLMTPTYDLESGFRSIEIPYPNPLPLPEPGKVWGHIYGIKVYVEDPE